MTDKENGKGKREDKREDGHGDERKAGPEAGYLGGQLLLAMPAMLDPRFERAVIYLCAHNADGAIGLVINRRLESVSFADLISQLKIDVAPESDTESGTGPDKGPDTEPPIIRLGGPVEIGRGFVLHGRDYQRDETILIDDAIAVTATVEVVRDIALGEGPRDRVVILGYAGWGPGQLDGEIQENAWLTVASDHALLFDDAIDDKWQRALNKLGIDAALLSNDAGRA